MKINIDKLKIAHRGLFNTSTPENSLGAFQKCIDSNVPIELDIHILKDDCLVVFHDDNTKRLTGLDAKLKDLTFKEIENLNLLNTSYTIPKLNDVLKLVDGKVLIDIEIKTDVKKF